MSRLKEMRLDVPFGRLLAPMFHEADDAAIAIEATRILESGILPTLEVVPLTQSRTLTDATLYAIVQGALGWHAVRLLIAQHKLPPQPRLPTRVRLNDGQWRRAGLVARIAELAHRFRLPRRGPARA